MSRFSVTTWISLLYVFLEVVPFSPLINERRPSGRVVAGGGGLGAGGVKVSGRIESAVFYVFIFLVALEVSRSVRGGRRNADKVVQRFLFSL